MVLNYLSEDSFPYPLVIYFCDSCSLFAVSASFYLEGLGPWRADARFGKGPASGCAQKRDNHHDKPET
jgi:hypothetical protein